MRARNLKPGFFKNEKLAECDPLARILFEGLWCMADRDGYIEYRPKRIKVETLPYDSINIEKFLEQLSTTQFITIWCVKSPDGEKIPKVIEVNNFLKHQNPHKNEKKSEIKPLFDNPEISGNFVKLHEISKTTRAESLFSESLLLNPKEPPSGGCPEPSPASEPPVADPPVIEIPLVKKYGSYQVIQNQVDEWQQDYPGIDVMQQLRHIKQWNKSHPSQRKTRGGILKHITGWLAKEQNKCRNGPKQSSGNRLQDANIEAARQFLEEN